MRVSVFGVCVGERERRCHRRWEQKNATVSNTRSQRAESDNSENCWESAAGL